MSEHYDLLPCPFCGGLPEGADGPPSLHIRCSTPGCGARQYGIPIEAAVYKWNSRRDAALRELCGAADTVVRLHDEVVECTRPGGVDANEYDGAFERLRSLIAAVGLPMRPSSPETLEE